MVGLSGPVQCKCLRQGWAGGWAGGGDGPLAVTSNYYSDGRHLHLDYWAESLQAVLVAQLG